MTFIDKIVWITGASSGIGEALAVAFSRAGAVLVLSARREEELERVRQRCDRPDAHLCLPLDVTDVDRMPALTEQVVGRYGRIDILVNNAGISQRSLVKNTAYEVDERIMRVNFLGAVALTKAVLPHMLERGRGQVVAMSSLAGKIPSPWRSAYVASKHAMQGFFHSMQAELYDEGIRVTVVCPGYIRTDVVRNALTADGSAKGETSQKQEEGMSPQALARRVLDAIRKEEAEVAIGGGEMWAITAKRFFPRIFRWVLRRIDVT